LNEELRIGGANLLKQILELMKRVDFIPTFFILHENKVEV
jgi:hypothetical protein